MKVSTTIAVVVAFLACWRVYPELGLTDNIMQGISDFSVTFLYKPVAELESQRDLETLRAWDDRIFLWIPTPPSLSAVDMKIPSRDGNGRPITLTTYTPKSKKPHETRPVVMYFHSGGFVRFTRHEAIAAWLAEVTDVVVVTVEYRRTPSAAYPAAFNDCVDATKYVAAHMGDFGGDPDAKIHLAGVSAGGNLAGAVSLYFSTIEPDFPLGSSFIGFGMLSKHPVTQSRATYGARYSSMTEADLSAMWRVYAPADVECDAFCQPFVAEDALLKNFPRSIFVSGSRDGFRDEDETFALRVKKTSSFESSSHRVVGTHTGSVANLVLKSRIFGLDYDDETRIMRRTKELFHDGE